MDFNNSLPQFDSSYFIAALIVFALTLIALWKIFEKAGEAGWKAIVPVYNLVVLFRLVGLSPWLILLYLLSGILLIGPIITLILSIVLAVKVSRAYGHGGGYALGLLFLSPIFYMIIGFGSSSYVGPKN